MEAPPTGPPRPSATCSEEAATRPITPLVVDGALDDQARGDHIFAGAVVVHRGLDGLGALIARADAMIRDAFAPHDPRHAHRYLDGPAYGAISEALISDFQRSAEVGALFRVLLGQAGVDGKRVFWDRLRLRIQPPGERHMSRRVLNLAPHRDTWGSNLLCQINWWAPLYPVTPGRTMAIYPDCWQTPVANTGAAWDYDALRKCRTGDYPLLPVATGDTPLGAPWPVVIAPGELLCFSGAHLHASLGNMTDTARFSMETRTVALDDLPEKRGAPDHDHAAPRRPLDWFRRISDGAPLEDIYNEEVDTTGYDPVSA